MTAIWLLNYFAFKIELSYVLKMGAIHKILMKLFSNQLSLIAIA